MTTPAENLQAALNALVESKFLSLEAAELVTKLRANVATVTAENAHNRERIAELERRNANALAENGALAEKVAKIGEREAACAKREAAITTLEQGKAVAEAQSATMRECLSLVFRNAEMREHIYGRVPATAAVHPQAHGTQGQYGSPGFVPGNPDGTVNVDNTRARTQT
jgi:hypothetical protein